MSQISIQSLFKPPEKRRSAWRSHTGSGIFHGLIFLLFALITVPAVREIQQRPMHTTLIAPVIPEYNTKIITPHDVMQPKLVVRREPPPAKEPPAIKPPVVKVPEPKRPIIAVAPEIKPIEPEAALLPQPKLAAPAPKPEVKTGVFQATEQAKAQQVPKAVAVGGFGDPNGVRPSDSQSSQLAIARVGSFDQPDGSGHAGGGGHAASGGVRTASVGSFGDGGVNASTAGTSKRGVQTGGFADSSEAPTQAAHTRTVPAQPALVPVEILYKPKPAYTQEARNLKIEGEVSLEVVFTATGSVRVMRVVRGLGHGLDEAAEQAATQVKFRPASRGGVPVDTNATINITFELT